MVQWSAVVLAASRGPDDPMARAYGVAHKCKIEIAGKPMLAHVMAALQQSGLFHKTAVSIDDPAVARAIIGNAPVAIELSRDSAPQSALASIRAINGYPVLITTGDHPLLTPAMLTTCCQQALALNADVTVGLAKAQVISAAYPETRRTYFPLGHDRVSGCNLFTIHNERGLRLLEAWSGLEKNRKKPWKLVAAFGLKPIILLLLGRLTLARAFQIVSTKLGITVLPNLLPFAEAAIDVDKPEDKDLVERIFAGRSKMDSQST